MIAFAQDTTSDTVSSTVQASEPVLVPGNLSQAGAQNGPASWIQLVFLGAVVLFMWLFVIRPQAKRQKETKKFLDALAVGQQVVTTAGIIGTVTKVSEMTVSLDVGKTEVRLLKTAISGKFDIAAQ